MSRMLVVAGLCFLGIASACGTPQGAANMEAEEEMEETSGNDRMMALDYLLQTGNEEAFAQAFQGFFPGPG